LPLRVIVWPLASIVVLLEIVLGLVFVIMPSQAMITVPPPESAEFRAASVGVETVPPAQETNGLNIRTARVKNELRRSRVRPDLPVGLCMIG
jgi:hypothetical protein